MTQQIPEPGPAEDPAAATGFRRLLGYRTAEWREGHAVLEMDLDERHMNRAGVLHGGALATLIDTACGLVEKYHLGRMKNGNRESKFLFKAQRE